MPLTEEPETILAADGTVLEQHLYRNLKRTTLGDGLVVLIDDENQARSARKATAFEGGEDLVITGGFYSIGGSSAAKHYTEVHHQYKSALDDKDRDFRRKRDQEAHEREQRRKQEAHDLDMEIRRKRELDAYEREEKRKQEAHDLQMAIQREELAKTQRERERFEKKQANALKRQRVQPEYGYNNGYGYGNPAGFRPTPADYGLPVNPNQPWAPPPLSNAARPAPLNSQSASRVSFPEPHPAPPPMPRAQTDSQVITPRVGGVGFTSQNSHGSSGGDGNMDEDDDNSDVQPAL